MDEETQGNKHDEQLHRLWYLVSLTIWSYVSYNFLIIDLACCQQRSNWLFGHNTTLTSSLSKKVYISNNML